MPLTSSGLRWWRRRRARRYTESRGRLCRLSRYRRGIGRHLDLPVIALSREETGDHFGWRAAFLSLDVSRLDHGVGHGLQRPSGRCRPGVGTHATGALRHLHRTSAGVPAFVNVDPFVGVPAAGEEVANRVCGGGRPVADEDLRRHRWGVVVEHRRGRGAQLTGAIAPAEVPSSSRRLCRSSECKLSFGTQLQPNEQSKATLSRALSRWASS